MTRMTRKAAEERKEILPFSGFGFTTYVYTAGRLFTKGLECRPLH